MIDHLEINTRQMAASLHFYADVLAPLGYVQKPDGAAKGFTDGVSLDFFLAEGEPSINVHYAFATPDRMTVDRIYQAAEAAGHALDRAPALPRSRHISTRTIM